MTGFVMAFVDKVEVIDKFDVPKASPSSMYGQINTLIDGSKAMVDQYSDKLVDAIDNMSNIGTFEDGNIIPDQYTPSIGQMETVNFPDDTESAEIGPIVEPEEPDINNNVSDVVEEPYPITPDLSWESEPVEMGTVEPPDTSEEIQVERANRPDELVITENVEEAHLQQLITVAFLMLMLIVGMSFWYL